MTRRLDTSVCQRQWTRRGPPRARLDVRPRASDQVSPQTLQNVKHVLERKRLATAAQSQSLHYYSVSPGELVDTILGSVKVKRQRGLPVIDPDQDDRLVGIVTKTDLLATDREGVLVQDVMTASPVSVRDSDPVAVAVELMGKFEVEVLPVVSGKTGRCVGVLTIDDVRSKSKAGGQGMAGEREMSVDM